MASVSFAPGDPKTPSYLRTKENGWNGSRYIGLPTPVAPPAQYDQSINYEPQPRQQTDQPIWTAPNGAPQQWQPATATGRYQAPPMQPPAPSSFAGRPAPTNYSTATPRQPTSNTGPFRFGGQQPSVPAQPSFPYTPTDFGGGDPAQQQRQITDARSGTAPAGFTQQKWQDPSQGTSHKYTAGTTLAGSGSIGDILRHPQFSGWTQVGGDKIKSPDGNIYDLFYDYGGPNQRIQYTLVGGPRWEAEQHNGFQGNVGGVTGYGTPGNPMPPGMAGGQSSSYPAGGASGTGYGDPNADLFVNEVLSRLQALHTPINDPYRDLLQKMGLERVDALGGAPYTAGEDAALRAQYMDPLSQARDSALERRTEQLGRYGYLPSSGLFQDQLGEIEQGYQGAVGKASNDLAVRAIDEKQRRGDEQLDILGQLLGVSTAARGEQDARGREAVTTANLLPMMDERRLGQMLQASDSGGQQQQMLLSTLMQLMNAQQQQANYNQQNSQQDSAAWGQYLGYLLQNWDSIFG